MEPNKNYLRSAKLGDTRKNCPNFFLKEKRAYFEKLLSSTSQVLNIWSYNLHITCQKTLCTLIKCFLKFFVPHKARKCRPKKFFRRRNSPFSKKKCVLNNFVDTKETILFFPQYLSVNLVTPHKLFPDVFHTPYYEKKGYSFLTYLFVATP